MITTMLELLLSAFGIGIPLTYLWLEAAAMRRMQSNQWPIRYGKPTGKTNAVRTKWRH